VRSRTNAKKSRPSLGASSHDPGSVDERPGCVPFSVVLQAVAGDSIGPRAGVVRGNGETCSVRREWHDLRSVREIGTRTGDRQLVRMGTTLPVIRRGQLDRGRTSGSARPGKLFSHADARALRSSSTHDTCGRDGCLETTPPATPDGQ